MDVAGWYPYSASLVPHSAWLPTAAATAAMVAFGFATFIDSSQSMPIPVLLAPVQWAIIGGTSVLAFALAVLCLDRWERPTY